MLTIENMSSLSDWNKVLHMPHNLIYKHWQTLNSLSTMHVKWRPLANIMFAACKFRKCGFTSIRASLAENWINNGGWLLESCCKFSADGLNGWQSKKQKTLGMYVCMSVSNETKRRYFCLCVFATGVFIFIWGKIEAFYYEQRFSISAIETKW
jgi:hypothetical protein